LAIRVQVAERQIEKQFGRPAIVRHIQGASAAHGDTWGDRLTVLLINLAALMKCEISDLRLDHDPPLAARAHGREPGSAKTFYLPAANDPEHLNYRPHGPQFSGSHLIKTNIRGEHGQHPDRVLIKKEKRRQRGPKPKRGPKIQSRGFDKSAKSKWATRPFDRRSK
jgi:hypothetical protein